MGFNKLASFFGLDDNDDELNYDGMMQDEANSQGVNKNNVVALKAQTQESHSAIRIVEPRHYSDAKEIAKDLLEQKAVLVNFKSVNSDQMCRISDFLSGTLYAIKGDMKQVDQYVILFTPSNFAIDSEIASELMD
ncbi:cell division protein SepF [Bombilactobacillus thymidiniphilus]|uniref:Cell division protein SepF n=1 Tax=Bombilactobacillus thymidiniphilus TaxID=2923363 RepID=A0ABY4PDD9_9LACO|nr:cell division protein SepF [Bombilactobacillus thymidiniphilus]UQS83788.1 cell division protein SepF [Bombilactobacillus thymidiniphilus]